MNIKQLFLAVISTATLSSCGATYFPPARNQYPSPTKPSTTNVMSRSDVEREYAELMKTYKPPTADVLNDLLNDSDPSSPTVSITIKNDSSCNMVFNITGNGITTKIPIAAGQMGYTMLKRGPYQLSGMVCNKIYRQNVNITDSHRITLQ